MYNNEDLRRAFSIVDNFISDCDLSVCSVSLKDRATFRNMIRNIAASLDQE